MKKDFIYRFTFHLPDCETKNNVRKSFGALLRKLNLRYRTVIEFQPYRLQAHGDSRPWELRFLILPPRGRIEDYVESLQYLYRYGIHEYQTQHPISGDVSIYRNRRDSLFLILQNIDGLP